MRQKYDKTKIIAFWISFIAALLFGCAGVIMPPLGIIDSSVLIFIGELLGFAAGILGIDLAIDNKISRKLKKKDEDE